MRFLEFTAHENGKPLLIREDLVGGWQFHRGHGLLLTVGQDMVDIEIKEGPEEFLRIVHGDPKVKENRPRSAGRSRTVDTVGEDLVQCGASSRKADNMRES